MAADHKFDVLQHKIFVAAKSPLPPIEAAIHNEIKKRADILYWYMPEEKKTWGYAILDKPIFSDSFLPHCKVQIEGVEVQFKPWEKQDPISVAEVLKWHSTIKPYAAFKITAEGLPKFVEPDTPITFSLVVQNKTLTTHKLTKVEVLSCNDYVSVKPNFPGRAHSVDIPGRATHKVTVEFTSDGFGIFQPIFVLHFDHDQTKTAGFKATINVSEEEIEKQKAALKPVTFQEPDLVKRQVIWTWGPGRASKMHKHTDLDTFYQVPLPAYEVPEGVQQDIDLIGKPGEKSQYNPWHTRDNFKQRLQKLLWVEEAEHRKFMRRYDLYDRTLESIFEFQKGGYTYYVTEDEPVFRIRVPGLAEKRPSVLYNDSIFVWIPETKDVEYEGRVTLVETDSILCIFNPRFIEAFNRSMKFNIRFVGHRLQFRLMHRALDRVNMDVVFPPAEVIDFAMSRSVNQWNKIKADSLELNDPHLRNNLEQMQILEAALNRQFHPKKIPLLLFGAFGCGKTRVLVEVTRQILKNFKDARILICAPSNSAADVFAKKLADYPEFTAALAQKREPGLLRFYAMHYNARTVASEIFPYTSYLADKEIFDHPPASAICRRRVIVSTASNSAALYGLGVPSTFFTHIIIDEAAQMMEPEALVPLTLANPNTTIILAGDDKQLGPRLYSSSVKHHRLGSSIMERLRYTGPYQPTEEGPSPHIFELTKNYRSHQKILEFSSEEFYQGKLQSLADKNVVDKLLPWKDLPNKKFPVLFVAVPGEDLRDADSPSWFNMHEVAQVSKIVDSILRDPNFNLSPKEIGVISAFYKQNVKIRDRLRDTANRDVFVGSVEEFQGKEFMAVIVSTVRASRLWEQRYDRPFSMGFLNDERMMNTAFTRAKALLVVVGDPFVLMEDAHWNRFIRFCIKNGSYKGDRPESPYLAKRMEREQKLVQAFQRGGLASAVAAANEAAKPSESSSSTSSSSSASQPQPEVAEDELDGIDEDEAYESLYDGEAAPAPAYQQNGWPSSQAEANSNRPPAMTQPLLADQASSSEKVQQLNSMLAFLALAQKQQQQLQVQQQPQMPTPAAPPVAAPTVPLSASPIGASNANELRVLCMWGQEPLILSRGGPVLPAVVVDRTQYVDVEVATFDSVVSISKQATMYCIVCSTPSTNQHQMGGTIRWRGVPFAGELFVCAPILDFDDRFTEVLQMRAQIIVRLHRRTQHAWMPIAPHTVTDSPEIVTVQRK